MRTIAAIILCFYFAFSKAQEVPQLETYSLSNGMKIYLLKYGKIPAVAVRFVINTGKKNETPGQQGYSEITSALLLRGNSKYTEEAQNDSAFKLGGELKSDVTFDYTNINAKFLYKDLDKGMDLFSSAILHPSLDKEKLSQYLQYLSDYNSPAKMDVANLAAVYSNLSIYGAANPLGRMYYKKQLQPITTEKIKEFYDFNYTPKNASVIVCGNFDAAEVKSIIQKYFGSWQSTYGEVNGVSLDKPSIKTQEIAFVNRSSATQCALRWTETAPSVKDKDYMPFSVANQMFSRLLFVEIREKGGKTYSIASNYKTSQFSNLFTVSCSIRSNELISTIQLYDKTLQDFNAQASLNAKDFEAAVTSLKMGDYLTEMPDDVLAFYNPLVYDFNKRKNYLADLQAVKQEDVLKAIKKYFKPAQYKLVIAGDEKIVGSQLQSIKGLQRYKAADIEKDN